MEQVKSIITTLDLNSLHELKKHLDNTINTLEDQQLRLKIKQEVKDNGYSLQPTYSESIEGLNRMYLKLYVRISTWDKEDFTGATIDGLDDKQDPWYDELELDYCPQGDNYEDVIGEWIFNDWDDPVEARAYTYVNIYYSNIPCPKEGTKFTCINEDGEIEHWSIKDGLYLGNKKVDSIDHWNDYDLCIISMDEKGSD